MNFLKNELNNLYSLNQSQQIKIIKYLVELQLNIFCGENKTAGLTIIETIQSAKKAFLELPETSPHKKFTLPESPDGEIFKKKSP